MFAIEEDLDKKLWLYAIHLGKDRSEVINDLLRPIVASMVLYDSRDRRGSRSVSSLRSGGLRLMVSHKANQVGQNDFADHIRRANSLAGNEQRDCATLRVRRQGKAASGRPGWWCHSGGFQVQIDKAALAYSSSDPGRGSGT